MCEGCWHEEGAPRINNERVRLAAAAITALYVDHLAGGGLHIVTDDWNLEDSSVEFCERHMAEHGADAAERAALATLKPLSQAERASALALERGFWSDTPREDV